MGINLYETREDLERESELAGIAEICFQVQMHKLPPSHGIDYAATRDGKLVAFLELKTRRFPFNQYPTTVINFKKFCRLCEYSDAAGVSPCLLIKWSDQVRYLVLDKDARASAVHKWGGQTTNPRDEEDLQVMTHFSISLFKKC